MKKYLQKLDTLGLLLLVGAVIWYSVSNVWGPVNLGLAIAGGALVIVGIAANYRQILSSLGKRSTKHATNYVISLILVIAVVSGLNFIGQRHPKRIDTTGSGRFTLAPQTVKILKDLKNDVKITAFFPGGDHAPLRELLKEYRTETQKIRYEFIDPDRQPEIAKQNEVTVYGAFQNPLTGATIKFGTVVVSLGERSEKIEKRSEEVAEQDLTNAIIRVSRSEKKKVYFVEGHGEKGPSDEEQKGYSAAKKALEDQGYAVEAVNLAAAGQVPADARVLVMAGPTMEPFPQEMEFVREFLGKGGGLFLLVDPAPAPSFDSFLKEWGISVKNDLVLDVSGVGRLLGQGPSVPLVTSYEGHAITERFNAMTFFPFTRSVDRAEDAPDDVQVETLFKSNENSWGETNLNSQEATYDPATDRKGPLPLGIAATREIKSVAEDGSAKKARIVVTGTSNFAVNAYFPTMGNGNLFLNIISWLAQDEDLISIRPKAPEDRRLVLSQSQMAVIRLLTIIVLPGIALVAGIFVVMNRRRK